MTGEIQRGSWSSASQFFITALGSAVGLGNIWRFPNVVYDNGGAVFLIPYMIIMIFLAIPLMLVEAAIGQYSKKGPIQVWVLCPILKGIGMSIFFYGIINKIYYNTPLSWATYYFVNSMSDVLPWSFCNPEWATDTCTTNATQFLYSPNATSPEEDFFYQHTLKLSGDAEVMGDFSWEVYICNCVLWVVIFAGISFGTASFGKLAYFTSLFPYFMITAMVIYTATLPGAAKGVEYYMKVEDFSKLAEIKIWRDAMAQVFYSTGCSGGGIILLSSFNRFRHNILRDVIILPFIDALTSIYAGFAVFMVLGYMAEVQNAKVEDVVEGGAGLIFITYAAAFSEMPGGNVWGVFFFFMIMILGLSSQFPTIEMLCSGIQDGVAFFRKSRFHNLSLRLGVVLLCLAGTTVFYFGNGYYWYSLIDKRVAGIPAMAIALFEVLGICWVYNGPFKQELLNNIEEMIGKDWSSCQKSAFNVTKYFLLICWLIIAPITLTFLLIMDFINIEPLTLFDYVYPDWAVGIAWAMVAFAPVSVIIYGIYISCVYKSFFRALRPTKSWKAAKDEVDEEVIIASKLSQIPPQTPVPMFPTGPLYYPSNSIPLKTMPAVSDGKYHY